MSAGEDRFGWRRRAAFSGRQAARAPFEAAFPYLPATVIARIQRRRLRKAIREAHRHVPHYRELMRKLSLDPGDFTSPADLAKLPPASREDLQRDPERFVSELHPVERCIEYRSGGSTAEPVSVFRRPEMDFAARAIDERFRLEVARAAGSLRFSSATILLPDEPGRSPFSRFTLIPETARVSRTVLSMLDPPETIIEQVDRIQPQVISGYGSYLERVFDSLARAGRTTFPPRVAVFASDELSDQSRRLIGERFGIEVLGAYRAIEATHLGFECRAHSGYHQHVDVCPIRIVDDEARTLGPGAEGQVLVSNLVAKGTMLLNYRLGDRAAWSGEPCACGRSLPTITGVRGRHGEWIRRPDGEAIHGQAIRDIMRRHRGLLRYQALQRRDGEIAVTVVAAPGCDRAELGRAVRAELAERLGTAPSVEFADDLPRTARGKTLRIVSELEPLSESRSVL